MVSVLCLLQQLHPRHFWSDIRSAERRDMLVPSARTQLGRRSFHVAAPAVWNALPSQLSSSSSSRGQFRAVLKTHLCTQGYGHLWELLLKSVLFYITLRSVYGMSRPSVVYRLSVTLFHLKLFDNIFAPSNRLGTRTLY